MFDGVTYAGCVIISALFEFPETMRDLQCFQLTVTSDYACAMTVSPQFSSPHFTTLDYLLYTLLGYRL